jgi:hypothetical protein
MVPPADPVPLGPPSHIRTPHRFTASGIVIVCAGGQYVRMNAESGTVPEAR